MIEIDIDRKDNVYKLQIQGHANYAEYGKDIICASVSMLYYTLLYSLRDLSDKDKVKLKNIQTVKGDTVLEFEANKKDFNELNIILQTIVTGFLLLQDTYNENVRLVMTESLFL